KTPDWLKFVHVLRRDLLERTVAPAVVGSPDHQPVAVFRLLQALRRYRFIVLQNRGRGCRRLRLSRPLRLLLPREGSENQHQRDSARKNEGLETAFVKHTWSPRLLFENTDF